jgi:hypothetical protein
MSIFAIRDDDINAFSSVEVLSRIYLNELSYLRPSLCLTPQAGDVYRSILENELSMPTKAEKIVFAKKVLDSGARVFHDWRDNKKLPDFLREVLSRGGEVCLHGVSHNPSQLGFECEGPAPSQEVFRSILDELKVELGDPIRLFSPPNNSIKTQWLDLVRENGLSMVTSVGVRPNECDWSLDSVASMAKILPIHIVSRGRQRAWARCSYRGVSTIQSYPISIFSKEKDVLKAMMSARKREKNFVLEIHSYQFERPDWL